MNEALLSLKKLFKNQRGRYKFLILTGSFLFNLYDSKENQNKFLKNLKKAGDIDILIVSSKFLLPWELKADEKIMPPEKIINNFNNGQIGIVATKIKTRKFLLSVQFIYPKYFKFLYSLERKGIPYFRKFSLNRNVSIHCGFKDCRKYLFAKDKRHSNGLLIFKHRPVVNNRFYMNDFQQMMLLSREFFNPLEFKKIRKDLIKEIYNRFIKENVENLTDFMNIFYNRKSWPKAFNQIIYNEIKTMQG
ncbi:MAG: hypothetical protein AAB584_02145 [Patescibacteria group bacterium]